MPQIMVTGDPLICYCGKPTKIYDSLFRRNFCSDECANDLLAFLGGCSKSIEVMKEIKAGDFRIRGPVVTLHETLARHQVSKTASIDKIDAQVQAKLDEDRQKAQLRKIGIDEETIEAMFKAKL